MHLFSRILIIIGVFLLALSLYLLYLRNSPHPLAFEQKPKSGVVAQNEAPKTLEIPSIGVHLPIIPSLIEDESWSTTSVGVSYLASSPQPGKKGNSVLYGHNWKSLLSNLHKVTPGSKVIIVDKNNKKQEFVVEYTAVVDPSQTYIIDNTEDARVTIYTCTGFLDSKRFVVVAKPASTYGINN